jgi:hypothetical protein
MKAPEDWSVDDLYKNLQHAVDLELWTIPLYLSALYSIRDLDKMEKKDYPVSAKLLVSVAVQEMLHLELASNLCIALGHVPEFERPHYDDPTRIPFIHPDPADLPERLRGYVVGIGPLDQNQLKLFCAIELPEVPSKIAWADKDSYDSIGELYEALKVGVTKLWGSCYVGAQKDYMQAAAFEGYTPRLNIDIGFSQKITDLKSALDSIDAIVAQGEGASGHNVPREFEPPKQTDAQQYHSGWFAPTLSHYQKLSIILANEHHLPAIYPRAEQASDEQEKRKTALIEQFSLLLEALRETFHPDSKGLTKTFWPAMTTMQDRITAVWRAGGVPSFSD